MDDQIILCILVLTTGNVASMYFHWSSPVILKPTLHTNETECDFGFSMGFQDTEPPKLIVGAPRSDFIGKVYQCSIDGIEQPISCEKLDIDMKKLANYSLEISPDQYFYLGASIAANEDNFLTCAPLWIGKKGAKSDAYGTCFMYKNSTFQRYKGSFEGFLIGRHRFIDIVAGGTGWNTLYDNTNKLIMVAKTSLKGDLVYVPSDTPLNYSKSIELPILNKNKMLLQLFTNVGTGLAAGIFFSNATVYAVSVTSERMTAQILFFKYNRHEMTVEIIKNEKDDMYFAITNDLIGSMFGAALCAADLNRDGYSDLIVGAPARHDNDDIMAYDQGAVYIYIGGDMKINDNTRMRTILGTETGGRFGSAITTKDLDGDGLPEIFVSSPYEAEGLGAVYILSGREVKKTLLEPGTNQQILLTDLKFSQKLQAEGFRTLGYSLQILSDLDHNGCNEIAIGSPGSDYVMLFRCIPTIYVTLSAQLSEAKFVKEQANDFVVAVCVYITYQSETSDIAGNLIVSTYIREDNAEITKSVFTINLSDKKHEHCINVTVLLKRKGPGIYNFKAEAELDLLKNNTILSTKDFNTTWVSLREDSETEKSLKIVRRCEADNCDPNLSMSLQGFRSQNYTLGSSEIEMVTVDVTNDGHDSYASCVRINVTGARVRQASACSQDKDTRYKCPLPSPLERNKSESIHIELDMSKTLSTDKELTVTVDLYEICEQSENTTRKFTKIPYVLTTDQIQVNGFTKDRNVTDVEILDEDIEVINDDHEYEIVNSGSVTWVNISAQITIDKRPFIGTYNISSLTENNCIVKGTVDKILFTCNFTLLPNSMKKVMVAMGIQKDKITSNLIDGKLNTTSQMLLYLNPSLAPKSRSVTTVITYLKDRSIVNNLPAIILGATALAIFVLAGFIFILYKANFFKRKQKQRLNELRESVRRKSMKRSNSEANEQNKSDDDDAGSIQMVDESPLRMSPTTSDDVVLIEEQK